MALLTASQGSIVAGKYRLEERIGGGGMGDVFRATVIASSRPVAVKLLHPELAQTEDLAQRFFQEAQAASRIQHPNVVDVVEAGKSDHGPFIAMEYLEGESVGAALRRHGRFDAEAAVATLLPVLEALDAAHRAGIIHRDLKPENVFYARASGSVPVVRLLDFGIAKMLDPGVPSPRTRTGVVFGTPDYLSPEQATGESPLDGRSDLFAVGVLFYELLTGSRPFRAATAVATAFRVVHADPPALSANGVTVDPRLEAVVLRLLQKSPEKRHATAADVVKDLDAIVPESRRRAALALLATRTRDESRRPPQVPLRVAEPVASARDTPPMPSFPPRFRGKYRVRGPVLRAVDEGLREKFGADARDKIVAQMPRAWAGDFRNDSINALVSYELEMLDAYLEIATERVVGDVDAWRSIGRAAVDGPLASLLRNVLRREAEGAAFARRGIAVWPRLFDFGAWTTGTAPDGGVELRIADFEPTSRALRLWLVGVIEQCARRAAGGDVTFIIARGEVSFTPELVVEVGWPR